VLVAFTYALFASMVGLASPRPWGLGASALAGGLGMVIAGACAATGHHAGAWWIVEGLFDPLLDLVEVGDCDAVACRRFELSADVAQRD
jgi:hypothetical protein